MRGRGRPFGLRDLRPGLFLLLGVVAAGGCVLQSQEQLSEESASEEDQLLEIENRALAESNSQLAQERDLLLKRVLELESEVARLEPDFPPPFKLSDLKNKDFVTQRMFSVKSGRCFDREGRTRCLFFSAPIDEGGGYLIYKTNRIFDADQEAPQIFDENGRRLSALTREVAEEIVLWEESDPYNAVRMASY